MAATLDQTIGQKQQSWLSSKLSSQTFWVLIAVILACIFLSFATDSFATTKNLYNITRNVTFVAIIALGMTLVIIIGGIDLSVGSTLSLASVVGASLMRDTGSIWLGVAGGVGTGLVIGAINGTAIAIFRLPAFVHTLGMLLTLRALALLVTAGHSVGRLPIGVMAFGRGNLLGVPNLLWLAAAVYVAAAIMLRHSELGRELFLVGSNERAAQFSGLRVVRAKFIAYLLCGGLAGLSGIAVVFRLGSGGPILGDNLLLMAIAAVVLGGTNILGGRGSYLGTVAGVILSVLLQSILSVMQLNEAWRQVIYGVVIITMLLVYGRGSKVQH